MIFAGCCALCGSCVPPGPDPPPVDATAHGIYVLNEGLFQMNNSTISYYDFENHQVAEDLFLSVNGRGLGDTGSDLKSYGSKLYCIVNRSNRVEIMNLNDAKSIKAISLPGKQPRKIVFHDNKAYVSCYDGDVVRIDTTSLEVDATVHSGDNPEGLCICNGKLYVANSGGLNYPNYGNTVSVISLSSFSVIKTIKVAENPWMLMSYNDQYVYVQSRGNYDDIAANLQKIDALTDEVVKTYDLEITGMAFYQHQAFIYSYNYNTASSWIKVLDLQTDKVVNNQFVTDGTTLQTPYGITINPANGDVYITDAYNYTVNGDVYCFSQEGKKKFSFSAGLNPNSIVFK